LIDNTLSKFIEQLPGMPSHEKYSFSGLNRISTINFAPKEIVGVVLDSQP
jgi:hypothetical protein